MSKIISVLICFALAAVCAAGAGSPALAVEEKELLGEWRCDATAFCMIIEPGGKLKWFSSSADGREIKSSCNGTYSISGNRLSVIVGPYKMLFSISPKELICEQGKRPVTYLRGKPVPTSVKASKVIVLTFSTKVPAPKIEAAILKLKPIELWIYDALESIRTVAAIVEPAIVENSLCLAKSDSAFLSAALSSGSQRAFGIPKILPVGSAFDELIFDSSIGPQKIMEVASKVGAETDPGVPDLIRFPNGHVLSGLLALSALPECKSVSPRIGRQAENVFIVQVSTKTPVEQIEASLTKLSPLVLGFSNASSDKQSIGISVAGPDALSKSISLARADKTFLTVRLPDTKRKREWKWDWVLDTFGKFPPPCNELTMWGSASVSQAKLMASLKKLGGKFELDSDFTYMVRADRNHVICAFIKAINDPNLSGVSQNKLKASE